MVMIRARAAMDLQNLRERFRLQGRIRSTMQADYPYRLIVRATTWQSICRELAADATGYGNFKNAVAVGNVKRARLYERVWNVLRDIEREEGGGTWLDT